MYFSPAEEKPYHICFAFPSSVLKNHKGVSRPYTYLDLLCVDVQVKDAYMQLANNPSSIPLSTVLMLANFREEWDIPVIKIITGTL